MRPKLYNDPRLPRRFWSKVAIKENGCWTWTAGLDQNGYSKFRWGQISAMWRGHRVAYVELVGAIPAGLVLDHLCRNRACVNPVHLEPVTHSENIRRGASAAFQRHKTHCIHGHPYDSENTGRQGVAGEYRYCRTCRRDQARRRYAAQGRKAVAA